MAEAKVGEEFITHELDEAIAIQRSIVEAERSLADIHPMQEARRIIKAALKKDEALLADLEQLGSEHGASGKVEEVAGAMAELMETTLKSATEAESEAYEATAVLLSMKRKQQDSGQAMIRIAREMKDTEMKDAATKFERAQREGSKELGGSLADMAVRIATAA